MKTIIICGGHLTPAIAVIETLRNRYPQTRLVYVGRKFAMEGDIANSLEYETCKELKIPFVSLNSGRLQRVFTRHTVLSLLKLPIGFTQSMLILLSEKPSVVISFGGYIALPVSVCAFILGIPVVTHEQTRTFGLANAIIHRFAKATCLSYPDTRGVPISSKVYITGNPVRSSIMKPVRIFTASGKNNLPVLFITGGSQGSRAINRVIAAILPILLKRYRIVHQCGSADNSADFDTLKEVKKRLTEKDAINYTLLQQIPGEIIGSILHQASLVIGRAGANTITEIGLIGVPAILIPLPFSGAGEQMENARYLEKTGLARVIVQNMLTPASLLEMIEWWEKNRTNLSEMSKKAKRAFIPDGSERILKIIETAVSSPAHA